MAHVIRSRPRGSLFFKAFFGSITETPYSHPGRSTPWNGQVLVGQLQVLRVLLGFNFQLVV
jgi:hypothetical protein